MRNDLQGALLRIREEDPEALTGYPMLPEHGDDGPPYRILLAPWAADVAEELHRRFGDNVKLQVGALGYPMGSGSGRVPDLPPAELGPDEAEVTLEGALSVRSGHAARHGLIIRNLTSRSLDFQTNGQVTALVVDPGTGEVAGGYSGMQYLPLVRFAASPGTPERIPLLVGTASFVPDLGYAVPPGPWAIRVPLELGDGRRLSTPMLPITVIP